MSHMNLPLIGLDKLLADSWNAMFKEWKPTLGWTLGMTLVPLLINIAFTLPQIAEPKLASNIVYQLVSFVIVWSASLYFLSGLIRYFLDNKKEIRISFQNVVSLAWIGALMALILIPAFILFIIPGIWLAVAFSMAMPIYLNEGKGGWEALKTSYNIVKGRWWATFIRFLVPNLVYGIGVGFIFGLLGAIGAVLVGTTAGGFFYALQQGADQATALAALGPVAIIVLPAGLLVFLILFLITSVLLTLVKTSVWINIYKSLSETVSK